MPRRLLLFATITFATLLISFYLWRPLLGHHVLGPPRPDPIPLPRATEALYATPTPAFDFDRLPLADAFDRLRQATGKNIFINWRALEAAGINKDHPVTLHTPDSRLDQSLRQLLQDVESTPPGARLDFTEDAGVITVSTRDDLVRNTSTRVYDVRELVQLDFARASTATTVPASWISPNLAGTLRIRPFRAVTLYTRWRIDTLLVPGPRDAASRQAALIADIQRSIDPTSWREAGGIVGGIRAINGQLIVSNTDANQLEVRYFLERRRWQFGLAALAARTLALLLPVLTLTTLTLLTSHRLGLRRRRSRGLCTNCGYDLRASPDQCPECGHVLTRA